MVELSPYPSHGPGRDRWIVDRRPQRKAVDPDIPYAFLVEEERTEAGRLANVATIFLTNRECPWRCVMCDLWQNTLTESVPPGAIPRQIAYALSRLAPATQIKLYNSGSFFDPNAIPFEDYGDIANAVLPYERVVVESHPALVGDRCFRFRDMLRGRLEVAMGLETAHPEALERLNKKLTIAQFEQAANRLRAESIDIRVFILIQPPFVPACDALLWAERSVDVAVACGATAISLIPTRGGNGALEQLALAGNFRRPELVTVEAAFAYGLSLAGPRIFVDLWDIEQVSSCAECQLPRVERLRRMNLSQELVPSVICGACGAGA